MIIDEIIEIKIKNITSLKHFSTKYRSVEIGKVIYIFASDLNKGSSILVNVECDVCQCKKILMFRKYSKNINRGGYYSCSSKCAVSKKENTNLNKYGVKNAIQNKDIQIKIKSIFLEKYGFDNPTKSVLIKKKRKETCKAKYNANSFVESKLFKEKMIEQFNVTNPMQSTIINSKRIKTSFERNEHENIAYQGSYELDFIKYCIENKIGISKPNFSIKYNKTKVYFPDFYIERLNLVIEIKSTYYLNLHSELNFLKKESTIKSGYKYLLILDKDYKELESLI